MSAKGKWHFYKPMTGVILCRSFALDPLWTTAPSRVTCKHCKRRLRAERSRG